MEDSNGSANRSIHQVSDPARRVVLKAGAASALLFAGCAPMPDDAKSVLGFASVPASRADTVVVPPGYVAQVHTRFTKTGDLLMPCHEYCGLGHSQMVATVKVVPRDQFRPDAQGRAYCGDRR